MNKKLIQYGLAGIVASSSYFISNNGTYAQPAHKLSITRTPLLHHNQDNETDNSPKERSLEEKVAMGMAFSGIAVLLGYFAYCGIKESRSRKKSS